MRFRYLAALSALVFVVGCGSDSGSQDASVSGQASAAYDDAKAKAGGMVEEAQAKIDTYKDQAMGQIEQAESQLGSLKEAAKKVSNDEVNGMVDEIGDKLDTAKAAVKNMKPDNMDSTKKVFEGSMAEAKDLYGDAQKKLGSLEIDTSSIPGMGGK